MFSVENIESIFVKTNPVTSPSVTGKPNILRPSRREVEIDVWKYLQHVVMGLNAHL